MQIVYAAPSAPVMNHLRPLTSQPPASGVAVVASAAGSEPAPGRGLGHREARPHRALGERTQVALLLLGGGDRLEQVHVALVGRGDVQGERAEQRPARLLEDDGPAAHVEPVPAVLAGTCGANTPASRAADWSSARSSAVSSRASAGMQTSRTKARGRAAGDRSTDRPRSRGGPCSGHRAGLDKLQQVSGPPALAGAGQAPAADGWRPTIAPVISRLT